MGVLTFGGVLKKVPNVIIGVVIVHNEEIIFLLRGALGH
jgi:hypothetical protein